MFFLTDPGHQSYVVSKGVRQNVCSLPIDVFLLQIQSKETFEFMKNYSKHEHLSKDFFFSGQTYFSLFHS